MAKYIPKEFEKKWRETWEIEKIYKTPSISNRKDKQYVLVMFPYPSGAGLHVGHVRVYTGTDVLARYFRMNGKKVLHPMGWDAFGLPAENAAIKAKKNPIDIVPQNIANFKKQMKMVGLSYDWDREVNTTDPNYYKWTQWLFIQFYKMGLLYKKDIPINFCPFCKTGLSEEEVLPNGTHERCGTKIEKRDLPQWIFKITTYADRLLKDLKGLNWPRGILEMQKNWIGKKEGVLVRHKIDGMNLTFETFSAYPAWLFADTFIVMAPEHPLVEKLIDNSPNAQNVKSFLAEHKSHTKEELLKGNLEKKGVFTGRYALDPFNGGRKMPIWLANFALMDFGTGIIRCSAHDVRDYEFARKYKIMLKEVVARTDEKIPINAHDNAGVLKDSGPFSGKKIDSDLIEEMLDWIEKNKIGRREVTYHLRDWIFSRQRYWGEPIPMINCKKDGWVTVPENELPVKLPYVKSYEPTGTGESPLTQIKEWVNVKCPQCGEPAKRETDTMPNWAGSCWYFLRFADPNNKNEAWNQLSIKNWQPVDWYIGGAEHAVLHLLYSRFWIKALEDAKLLNFSEPFLRLRNVGVVIAQDNRKMSKSFGNIINPDDVVAEYGADTLRVYEMFMAPFNQQIAWSTETLQGSYRFLKRVWEIFQNFKDVPDDKQLVVKLSKTITKITHDIAEMKFNTAIAAMMEFLNQWEESSAKSEARNPKPETNSNFQNSNLKHSNIVSSFDIRISSLSSENAKKFLQILAPFAPFMTEEIWRNIFEEKESIHLSSWPKIEGEIIEAEVTIPVQVNGRVRAVLKVPSNDVSETTVVKKAVAEEKVKKYIEGNTYKTIYVKGKILNFVF